MKLILKETIKDWRYGQGEPVPEEDSKSYDLEVSIDPTTDQLYVNLVDKKGIGLCLFVEVNEGKPCLHIANDIGGDNLAHVFGLKEGIVITPETDSPEKAPKNKYSYNSNQGLLYRGCEDEESGD